MTHGFQQQDAATGFSIPKSAALPQHGQKACPPKAPADKAPVKAREPRSFAPKG